MRDLRTSDYWGIVHAAFFSRVLKRDSIYSEMCDNENPGPRSTREIIPAKRCRAGMLDERDTDEVEWRG